MSLATPTLVVHGAADAVVPPRSATYLRPFLQLVPCHHQMPSEPGSIQCVYSVARPSHRRIFRAALDTFACAAEPKRLLLIHDGDHSFSDPVPRAALVRYLRRCVLCARSG